MGEYEANLGENLQRLVDRLKSGSYRAPAVKRVYIPKAGSNDKRPIGIPTYEDKILQRAVQLVLEPIYEEGVLRLLVWVQTGEIGPPMP